VGDQEGHLQAEKKLAVSVVANPSGKVPALQIATIL